MTYKKVMFISLNEENVFYKSIFFFQCIQLLVLYPVEISHNILCINCIHIPLYVNVLLPTFVFLFRNKLDSFSFHQKCSPSLNHKGADVSCKFLVVCWSLFSLLDY